MWLDALQVLLPAQMLAVHVTHVGNEEGIFVASLTGVFVNVLYALLQCATNHLLGEKCSVGVESLDWRHILLGSDDVD